MIIDPDMAAFDDLPPAVREALRNSAFNHRASELNPRNRNLAAAIAKMDRRRHERDAQSGLVAP